jgi:hypothetical protein
MAKREKKYDGDEVKIPSWFTIMNATLVAFCWYIIIVDRLSLSVTVDLWIKLRYRIVLKKKWTSNKKTNNRRIDESL